MKKIMMATVFMWVMFLMIGCNESDNAKALRVKTQEEAVDFFMGLLKGWDYIKIESVGVTERKISYCKLSENNCYVESFNTKDATETPPVDYTYFTKEVVFHHSIDGGTEFFQFKYQPQIDFVYNPEHILVEIENNLTDAKFTKDGYNLKFSFDIATYPNVERSYEYTGDSKIYFSTCDGQSEVYAASSSSVFDNKCQGLLSEFEGKVTSIDEAKNDMENRAEVFESSGQYTLRHMTLINDYELRQNNNGDAYLIADEGNIHTETYYTQGVSYICTEMDGVKTYSTEPGFACTLKRDVCDTIRDIPILERLSHFEMSCGGTTEELNKFYFYKSTIAYSDNSMTIRSENLFIDVVVGDNSDFFENLSFDFAPYN